MAWKETAGMVTKNLTNFKDVFELKGRIVIWLSIFIGLLLSQLTL